MCFYNEKYYIYYQCDDTRLPQDAGGSQGWNLAVTEDLEHYEVHQMVLKSDAEAGRRKTLRAGNVVIREERFYACYSVQAGTDTQIVTAVSEDGIHWTVTVQQLVLPPECEDKFEAMPSLFYEKETKKWLLTVSAEKKGPEAAYRGCILQYQSGDFTTWTEREMLWSPMRYEKIERPAFLPLENGSISCIRSIAMREKYIIGNDRRGRPAGVRRAEAVWMDAVWKWEEYFLKTDTGVCTEFSQFGK